MRILFFIVAISAMVVFSLPAWASLPFYNPDMGYTIWLPKTWNVASDGDLERAESVGYPVPVGGEDSDWQAGYVSPSGGPVLLVEIEPGRRPLTPDISNFNRFIVRTLREAGGEGFHLRDATYFGEKKTLRIESEVRVRGRSLLSLHYVVYTRRGMLNFVGYVEPGDEKARAAIDKAVLSLYLDDAVRYEPR
ncbi:MAG: hypothetical protein H0S80_00820 [Desulfovibrionaceae bacterium]|nr:hypothetical protein [Desulfovibrionaceae bacterium]